MTPAPRRSGYERHPLFRGWWIVVVAIVGQTFSLGPMLVFTLTWS
jgi:hypothetical protein